MKILSKGDQIRRIDADTYRFYSRNVSYVVKRSGKEWACECSDHKYWQTVCKHIWAVYFSLNLRQKVVSKVQPVIEVYNLEGCPECNSLNAVKIGLRHNLHGKVQRLMCKDCGHKFSQNKEFKKVKATPKAIISALDLYFKGVSQRKIVEYLKTVEEIKVTQPCVLKWIRKYIELMKPYLEKFTPQVEEVWHSDEMVQNVRNTKDIKVGPKGEEGNYYWMWNLMDHETRFWLANQITKHRDIEDVRKILKKAKETLNHQRPDFIVTDKLHAYDEVITKEFYTNTNPKRQG